MKKFYRKLNELNIEMDITPMEVNELEKARIKKSVLKCRKKSHLLRNISVVSVLLVASSISLSSAFPTLAANLPIVGNIFELFNKQDKYVFDEYSNYSTEIGVTKDSNGISVTLTEAVYNGENITIAYTMKSEMNLGERPALLGDLSASEFNGAYHDLGFERHYLTEKISETEYAGLYVFELIEGPKPEKLTVTLEGNSIIDLNNTDQTTYGDWDYQFTLQKLDNSTIDLRNDGYKTLANGVDITLSKMTKTPISTTLYLNEWVDPRVASMEEDDFRAIQIEYSVSDNLGNKQNIIHFRHVGHSTDFEPKFSHPRLTLRAFESDATSITITPTVHVLTVKNPDQDGSGPLEPVMEPYEIEPIVIPINK